MKLHESAEPEVAGARKQTGDVAMERSFAVMPCEPAE